MDQAPLPQLPVPKLKNTLDRYLRLVLPVVSKKDYERTKKIVEEFGRPGGEGEQLQALLEQYAKTKVNWVCDPIILQLNGVHYFGPCN